MNARNDDASGNASNGKVRYSGDRELTGLAEPDDARASHRNRKSPTIKSVANAFEVLDYLEECGAEAGVVEIAQVLGVHKSTASRLLATMESRGYVDRNAQTGKYSLGIRLVALSRAKLDQIDLRGHARHFLEELVSRTGETAHLAILDNGAIVYVDKVDTPQTLMMRSQIGYRIAAHCTALGKAILAELPDAILESVLDKQSFYRFTPNTITDPVALKEHLNRVRETGFALDDEEHEEGIRCVAAPVKDVSGRTIAAISVSGPTMRISRQRAEEMGRVVQGAARRLSESLGYVRPDRAT